MTLAVPSATGIGEVVTGLEISRAWVVDPVAGREGPADVVVADGTIEAVTWLSGSDARGLDDRGIVVAPGFIDLHAHFREPGDEDAETVASGTAAAAHGGFGTVCLMPDTSPALDEPGALARIQAAAGSSGSPVRVLAWGAVSAGRGGDRLAALGELADAGVVGFSDDGNPIASPVLLRSALAYAGGLGLPVLDHAEDRSLAEGAEANDGLVATVLGLRGASAAAEEAAVARDLALLADVLRDVPTARLHLAHLSTAGSLELVRGARAGGLPVTCDVAPHHLALSDEWLAGARRWAWEGSGDPWRDGAIVARPYETALRVSPPLRSPDDALACLEALADGTVDAIATDHSPRTAVDTDVEFGLAAGGIAGSETALGLVLAAVDAGRLPLARAIEALTVGPRRVLGDRIDPGAALVEGQPADLVVFDRSDTWTVTRESLASRGRNVPLLGRELPGRVLLTIAGGRLAYADATD